nr:MAG TPA: hypothetical protein [Caudoviricetes sp.]
MNAYFLSRAPIHIYKRKVTFGRGGGTPPKNNNPPTRRDLLGQALAGVGRQVS